MASYTVVGRGQDMTALVSVSVTGIDQETHVVDDIVIVNAVRNCLAAVPGVQSVIAQKYEQIITVI